MAHSAIMVTVPGERSETKPAELTVAMVELLLSQVSGGLMVFPAVSTTSATNCWPPAGAALNGLAFEPETCTWTLRTPQVVKGVGMLLTCEIPANKEIVPGTWAVSNPEVSTVATVPLLEPQLKGPTVEVMSTPLLNAAALSCRVCPIDLQTPVGVVMTTRSTFLWTYTVAVDFKVPLVAVMVTVPM